MLHLPLIVLQLTEATDVQESVDARIVALNATLQASRGRLDGVLINMLQQANASVFHSDALVQQCDVQRAYIGEHGQAALQRSAAE